MGAYKFSADWLKFVGFGIEFYYGSWALKLPGIEVTYHPHGYGYWFFGKYIQGGAK
jgi:hypothetical protein